jgi:hypothetical protein
MSRMKTVEKNWESVQNKVEEQRHNWINRLDTGEYIPKQNLQYELKGSRDCERLFEHVKLDRAWLPIIWSEEEEMQSNWMKYFARYEYRLIWGLTKECRSVLDHHCYTCSKLKYYVLINRKYFLNKIKGRRRLICWSNIKIVFCM